MGLITKVKTQISFGPMLCFISRGWGCYNIPIIIQHLTNFNGQSLLSFSRHDICDPNKCPASSHRPWQTWWVSISNVNLHHVVGHTIHRSWHHKLPHRVALGVIWLFLKLIYNLYINSSNYYAMLCNTYRCHTNYVGINWLSILILRQCYVIVILRNVA